ncbi:MAG: hypothetical protein JO062_22655 [Bryobacterales bacterium]|nr:hypothetical protein [Bryobacterales bacterium]
MPLLFDQVGRRSFSFFPAIVGIEHNEWLLRRATWTEVEVVNKKSGQELLIPRRFVGEVSAIEEPFLIVGLVKELEYREGAVWPHRRRVIQMPRAVNGGLPVRSFAPHAPAPVVGIRLEPPTKSRAWKRIAACVALVLMLIAAGILACVQAVESHMRGGRGAPAKASGAHDRFTTSGSARGQEKEQTPKIDRLLY